MADGGKDLLLEVKDLKTYFFLDEGTVRAVDGVTFDIQHGQTLGVVGESGCGKSVTGQSILRIVPPPGRIVEGQILFHRRVRRNGGSEVDVVVDLTQLDPRGRKIRSIRGAEIALIFQEPMTSFSPVHTIGNQIMESILLHRDVTKEQAKEIAIDMLSRCGLPRAEDVLRRYSWELSGGMRQRAMIARALVCQPSLLIADEPTTALDVTTEAQILDLMQTLQREMGMAILYITHDLGVIAEMAQEVIVMYLGKLMERADVYSLFYDPKHPYTQALLRSIPKLGRKRRTRLDTIEGMVPDPYNIPAGCAFHTRCRRFMPGVCDVEDPPMVDVGDGHLVKCFLY
ncbi:MAG: ABC transporter ATP-binding protein [Chloroflexi bacterium]|nr:ABC transporter ATP-binding protein [Chloroflexota bacterium]